MSKTVKHFLKQLGNLKSDLDKNPAVISKEVPKSKQLQLEDVVTDQELFNAVSTLFITGHYAHSVKNGFLYLNNIVKTKSGVNTNNPTKNTDGSALMSYVFSVNNPLLKLNPMSTDSEINEQLGYMHRHSAGGKSKLRN